MPSIWQSWTIISAETSWSAIRSATRSLHFHPEMNCTKSCRQLQEEIAGMEQRLQGSRQYIGQPKEQLEVESSEENDL